MLRTTTPQALQQVLRADQPALLIDVRTPMEYREFHATPAKNVPLDELDAATLTRDLAPGTTVYVLCRTGGRGAKACDRLSAAGLQHVVNVEGGTLAWEAAGLPITRGEKTMSLERQVRVAAGSFVLLGVILATAVHPYCIAVAAFIGAGLVFSGITDTCGMGLVLAKMPWNRSTATTCATRVGEKK